LRHTALLSVSLFFALAAPAAASTIPDVSLRAKKVVVTAGFADASVDYGVTDRLQLGAGGEFTLITPAFYGRVTFRMLDDTLLGDVGVHIAGGNYYPIFVRTIPGQFLFLGPVITRKLGSFAVLRASVGVVLTNDFDIVFPPGANDHFPPIVPPLSRKWGLGLSREAGASFDPLSFFLPNLELAFPIGADHELTLGGNAIIGWRGRF
jgi:hypothetical protein